MLRNRSLSGFDNAEPAAWTCNAHCPRGAGVSGSEALGSVWIGVGRGRLKSRHRIGKRLHRERLLVWLWVDVGADFFAVPAGDGEPVAEFGADAAPLGGGVGCGSEVFEAVPGGQAYL